MGFADALDASHTPAGPRCKIGIALQTFADPDLAALKAAIDDRQVTAARIGRAMRLEGHQLPDAAVRRHRAGDCSCGSR